jgi:hypothetical protein
MSSIILLQIIMFVAMYHIYFANRKNATHYSSILCVVLTHKNKGGNSAVNCLDACENKSLKFSRLV